MKSGTPPVVVKDRNGNQSNKIETPKWGRRRATPKKKFDFPINQFQPFFPTSSKPTLQALCQAAALLSCCLLVLKPPKSWVFRLAYHTAILLLVRWHPTPLQQGGWGDQALPTPLASNDVFKLKFLKKMLLLLFATAAHARANTTFLLNKVFVEMLPKLLLSSSK